MEEWFMIFRTNLYEHRYLVRVSGMTVIAALVLACSSSATDPPLLDREPSDEGTIVRVESISTSSAVNIRVMPSSADSVCGTTYTMSAETVIQFRERGTLLTATPDDLQVGQTIRVWVLNDLLLDTCPAEGTPEAIEILL